MAPVRRNTRQGFQHKAPLRQTGMRQDDRPITDLAGIVQNIQIQRARRIGNGTSAPEVRFDLMQKCHESNGLEAGANGGNRIHEGRIVRIGPGLSFIKGRNTGDFDAGAGQDGQRRLQRLGWRARRGRNIGA